MGRFSKSYNRHGDLVSVYVPTKEEVEAAKTRLADESLPDYRRYLAYRIISAGTK